MFYRTLDTLIMKFLFLVECSIPTSANTDKMYIPVFVNLLFFVDFPHFLYVYIAYMKRTLWIEYLKIS